MDVYDYPYLNLLELVNVPSILVISTSKTSRDLSVTLNSIEITAEVMDIDFEALGGDSCKCQFGGECICKSMSKKRKGSAGKHDDCTNCEGGCSCDAGSCACSAGSCSCSSAKKARTTPSVPEKSGCCSSKETTTAVIVEPKPSCCSSTKTSSTTPIDTPSSLPLLDRLEPVISIPKKVVEQEKCKCGCSSDAINCRECLTDGCDVHFARMSAMGSLF
jgi:hypothetical protein